MSSEKEAPTRILVTGANGQLGRQLIARLAEARASGSSSAAQVRALVRSERAADQLRELELASPPEIVIGDYSDVASLESAAKGCDAVVHLVGIIKEGRGASYWVAHEETCEALAQAAASAGVGHVVYMSIFGSTPDSDNTCLASKGRAEAILLGGQVPTTVLRVPMVIGPEDHASAALRGDARSRLVPLVAGGATMQQPIDSRDVISIILATLERPVDRGEALDVGGPERLTHRALVERAARIYQKKPLIVPVPLFIARGFARLMEKLLSNPPVTVAMLEVLQQDDRIDEAALCERLGIELTPLDETLLAYVGPDSTP